MKKLLSLILALIFVMSCMLTMTSCDLFGGTSTETPSSTPNNNVTDNNDNNNTDNNTDNNNNSNTGDNNNNQGNVFDDSYTALIDNGIPMYSFVYPENCSYSVYKAINDLAKDLEAISGAKFACIESSEALEYPDDKYILMGKTSFESSIEAIDKLPNNSDAYSIKLVNGNIVFAAHFNDGVLAAINYFIKNQLNENYDDSTNTLWLDEYEYEGKTAMPTAFNVKDISKYTIIYDNKVSGLYQAAEYLRDRIKEATGKTLTISSTSAAETPYEILLGNTNRPLSRKSYKNGTKLMEYSAVVERGQLQIVCGGAYSAQYAIETIVNTYFKSSTTSLKAGTYCATTLATEKVAYTKGTDVRIMTANIVPSGDGFDTPAVRMEIFARILVDYTPDFIGVQEMETTFHDLLTYYFKLLKESYGMEYSTTSLSTGSINAFNFIIYRSDKYTLDYENIKIASYNTNKNGHNVLSSAKFTSIEDPSVEIALLSGHWHWDKENVVYEKTQEHRQKIDADMMAAEFKNIQKLYPNAKIFCTGDFNSHRFDGKYLNQFLSDINGAISSDIAKNNGVLHESFKHNISGKEKVYIDHIIGTKGTFDVLLHAGTNNHSNKLTDHQPVYADIKFTK